MPKLSSLIALLGLSVFCFGVYAQVLDVVAEAKPFDLSPATINVPEEVEAGEAFLAKWTGPRNPSDYLVIRSADGEREFQRMAIGSEEVKQELSLSAPNQAGDYTVFYEVGDDHEPLAKANFKVISAAGYLALSSTARPGSEMSVVWSGPGNSGDRIYVHAKGVDKALYSVSASAKDAKPLVILAPKVAGDYELKLKTAERVLATARFKVKAVVSHVKVLTPIILSGESVQVAWDGPRNKGDRLAVAVVGEADYHSQRPAVSTTESPVKLVVSKDPGDYEVRLQTASGEILASQTFEVK